MTICCANCFILVVLYRENVTLANTRFAQYTETNSSAFCCTHSLCHLCVFGKRCDSINFYKILYHCHSKVAATIFIYSISLLPSMLIIWPMATLCKQCYVIKFCVQLYKMATDTYTNLTHAFGHDVSCNLFIWCFKDFKECRDDPESQGGGCTCCSHFWRKYRLNSAWRMLYSQATRPLPGDFSWKHS